MTATHERHCTTTCAGILYLAFELGWEKWKLAFTTGLGQKPRVRTIAARDLAALAQEIAKVKARFGLVPEAATVSCYEAGRDGFWLHRFLVQQGIVNHVVDAASIEVNRRLRRAKSDRLDASKLVTMLVRYRAGEHKLWSVCRAPSAAEEDQRQLHRELLALSRERTRLVNQVKGLLANQGVEIVVDGKLPQRLALVRLWDGTSLPEELQQRLLRAHARWQLIDRHSKDLENEQRRRLRRDQTPQVIKVRRLASLKGIGPGGSWLLTREIFGWRDIKNRRQLGGLAGLAPTPYHSSSIEREQGISKAGNKRVRWLLVQQAWLWLHYQPDSDLSRWYQRRFGRGGPRLRKIGIVALARKLLVALWKYVEHGEVPAGAVLVDWRLKINGRLPVAG